MTLGGNGCSTWCVLAGEWAQPEDGSECDVQVPPDWPWPTGVNRSCMDRGMRNGCSRARNLGQQWKVLLT